MSKPTYKVSPKGTVVTINPTTNILPQLTVLAPLAKRIKFKDPSNTFISLLDLSNTDIAKVDLTGVTVGTIKVNKDVYVKGNTTKLLIVKSLGVKSTISIGDLVMSQEIYLALTWLGYDITTLTEQELKLVKVVEDTYRSLGDSTDLDKLINTLKMILTKYRT